MPIRTIRTNNEPQLLPQLPPIIVDLIPLDQRADPVGTGLPGPLPAESLQQPANDAVALPVSTVSTREVHQHGQGSLGRRWFRVVLVIASLAALSALIAAILLAWSARQDIAALRQQNTILVIASLAALSTLIAAIFLAWSARQDIAALRQQNTALAARIAPLELMVASSTSGTNAAVPIPGETTTMLTLPGVTLKIIAIPTDTPLSNGGDVHGK